MFSIGNLNDVNCDEVNKYICEYNIDGITVYIGFNDQKTWEEARDECENPISGHLATFGDYNNEYTQLTEISSDIGNAWIGLDDRDSEGTWKFIDGDTSLWYVHFLIQ